MTVALERYRDRVAGASVVVCGCGASLAGFAPPAGVVTIGVNDVGRLFDPDYLVVLNAPAQFTPGRFEHVANSRAKAIFTHLELPIRHPEVVRFRLGSYAGVTPPLPGTLHYSRNSPYLAVQLGLHMGASRIGLIGVDFTDDHFFARTGTHPLSAQLAHIDAEYGRLADACAARGVELVNLSPVSRLTSLAKRDVALFVPDNGTTPLTIVSYATTPVAGVPAILARCIDARTPHRAVCVWATGDYGNGVRFEGGIAWRDDPASAADALAAADLVIAHNGRIAPEHRNIVAGKPVLTMAHNYGWNVDMRFVEAGGVGVVVGQYQATLPEFAGWDLVANPLPIREPPYQPEPKPDVVTIAFTPSGWHETYPPHHRLHWHAKGAETTARALAALADRYGVRVETTQGRLVPHAESMAMKRRAHIVIDEAATGSYHRNSLEGLAAGAVTVNGLGQRDGVEQALRHCSGADDDPFVRTTLAALPDTLARLVEAGPVALADRGRAGRRWLDRHWRFEDQWARLWVPAVERALQPSRPAARQLHPTPQPAPPQPVPPQPPPPHTGRVSVVIAFGGAERLPLLDAVLGGLQEQAKDVAEVVIAELGDRPVAGEIVRRHGTLHLFEVSDPPFHKARALTMGSAAARAPWLLWFDADLVAPLGFIAAGVAEAEVARLDCLVPWTAVEYLSAADTEAVLADRATAWATTPTAAFYSRQGACGGAVLVRRDFFVAEGGPNLAFRGWGGEDNAWFWKARVLGKAQITTAKERRLRHLYHPLSGGGGGTAHQQANPRYAQNVALLQEMRRLGTRDAFLARFPRPDAPASALPAGIAVTFEADAADAALCRAAAEAFGAGAPSAVAARENGFAVVIRHDGERVNTASVHRDAPDRVRIDTCAGAITVEASPDRLGSELGWRLLSFVSLAIATLDRHTKPPKSSFAVNDTKLATVRLLKPMTIARADDLNLREFAAFNHGRDYPRMRRWELPFALFQARLSSTSSLLDCTINPVDFDARLLSLYPHLLYRHWTPIQDGEFRLPVGVPDDAFDRITCINTLEHLLRPQRDALIAALARKLKPGGILVLTLDYYFNGFWERPALVRAGVMRPDRQEIFNGWNRVTIGEILERTASNDLYPVCDVPVEPSETDPGLYRNIEPYPHACIGLAFSKGFPAAALVPSRTLVLSLLTWNTCDTSIDSLRCVVEEATMLKRLCQKPFIIVVDNGSIDGTKEALRAFDREIDLPHKFIFNETNRGSSIARNQAIDVAIANNADYLLFIDGDIELVPFSSYAMLRHMENSGHLLGCLGADSSRFTPDRERASKYLFSLAGCSLQDINLVAWTQYGMFRRDVFESGVRFDENDPFCRAGWGFEDNDLAFQMFVRGYQNQKFGGITYLHRHHHSSIRVMRSLGIDPNASYRQRKEYVIRKWADTPSVQNGPLKYVRQINLRL